MEIPDMTAEGYTIDAVSCLANDQAIDAVNKAINDVRNEFILVNPGFAKKIKLINTSDYFNRNTDYMPDLIHPNASGNENLFNALKKHIAY